MVLLNNSPKIIGIKETSILPGEIAECPKGYEKNPVVQKYIKDGILSEVKKEKSGSTQKTNSTQKQGSAQTSADSDNSGNPQNPDDPDKSTK